jgi:hypothetical protein
MITKLTQPLVDRVNETPIGLDLILVTYGQIGVNEQLLCWLMHSILGKPEV